MYADLAYRSDKEPKVQHLKTRQRQHHALGYRHAMYLAQKESQEAATGLLGISHGKFLI